MVIMLLETEIKRYQKRQRIKVVLLTILPLLIGIAWFYPLLGFVIFFGWVSRLALHLFAVGLGAIFVREERSSTS
jgi:hypothetical protein